MSLEMFNLAGKTALVTGSSRGLGRAIASGLAEAGARIVLNGVNETNLRNAATDFRKAGREVATSRFDITDEDAVLAAFSELDERDVPVDILVNNAGVNHREPLLDLQTDDWRRVLDTNLTAAFVIGREAARRMIARGGGKIINVTSITAELVRSTIAPYASAKGGLKVLTKVMASEWAGHNIQVNAIGPGFMLTDMNKPLAADSSFDGWIKSRTPAGRWGRPEELAGTATFLASAASDFLSGQTLYVDGGLSSVI